jgi:murein DD-endopeptidase MepM/ murein hydrolase activator NlpD
MANKRPFTHSRAAVRLMAAAGVAALVAGCSDASRFGADPFSDPFSGSARTASQGVDRSPVGAIAAAPAQSAPSSAVESRPLPAPAASAPIPGAVASAARTPATNASAPRVAAAGAGHWSAEGGTPIIVAQGETAALLSTRYGVPADALLRTNGYNVASQIQPGSRLVIPVYRAGAAPVATARAPAAPVRTAAAAPAPALTAKPIAAKPVAAAKPAEPAKPLRKTEAEPMKAETAKAKPVDKKAVAKAAPEKTLVKAEPRIAAATPARAVKTERIARAAPSPAPAEVQAEAPEARSKPVVAEAPAETASARKVDTTATASIPPATDTKAVASDESRPEFRWPARGRIIQGFASGNDGINIAVPEGTQVKAAEGGVVAYAGNELKGYGNLVLIRHDNGWVSAYAHADQVLVKRDDIVRRGQVIAKAGKTGTVDQPQLHFELRQGAKPVDPMPHMER